MSNTPFQVYLINKFIEQIMNKKLKTHITALEFLKIIQVIGVLLSGIEDFYCQALEFCIAEHA